MSPVARHPWYRHQPTRDLERRTSDWSFFGDVSSIDGIRVGVQNGRDQVFTSVQRRVVSSDLSLSIDLTDVGPGGRHPDYALADGVWVFYAAWSLTSREHNGDLMIFAVPSGTEITAGIIADLEAGRYTHWSEPIGFVIRRAGQNLAYVNRNRVWWFDHEGYGIQLASAITADINIDLRAMVPSEAVQAWFLAWLKNTALASGQWDIILGDKLTGSIRTTLTAGIAADHSAQETEQITLHHDASTTMYPWISVNVTAAAPDPGLNLYLQGVKLY